MLKGESLTPPQATSLWDALERAAHQDFTWLVFHEGKGERPWTAGATVHLAERWAKALVELGVEPGDTVGVLLPNGVDFVGAFFGAQRAGAAAVPLAWPVVQGAPDVVHKALSPLVRAANLKVLVTTPECAGQPWGTKVLAAPHDDRIRGAPFTGHTAFLQFTSGSTGSPRGVVISQRAALASMRSMAQALGMTPEDVGVSWLPFFHDMGLVGVLLTSLEARFRVHVLRPAEFLMRPKRWLEVATDAEASLTVGPNFGYELAVKRAPAEGMRLHRLRAALSGSEPIHRSTLDGFAQKFAPAGFRGEVFRPVYGLAEATLGVTFTREGQVLPDTVVDTRPVPAVGPPVPGIDVAIRGEDGAERPDGAEGHIWVRGPSLMDGYFQNPAASAETLVDGWLRTGDLGLVRDGSLYVTGREKELVIQAGRKFHPYDIERVVAELVDTTPNGVVAVSRPSTASGTEELHVLVELRRQSQRPDVVALRGELLSVLGVRADHIALLPAGALPRTTSGKVKRTACAQRLEEFR